MKSITCDNCPNTVPVAEVEDAGWIHVGWANGHLHDACSATCGKAILDKMVEDENANPS